MPPVTTANGTLRATVANASASVSITGGSVANGAAGQYSTSTRALSVSSGVPAGATPVAGDLWIKDGTLWRQPEGGAAKAVATGVAAYGQMVERKQKDGVFYLPLTYTNGKTGLYQTADYSVWNLPGIPAGATPVAQDLWLKDGTLWRQVDGSSAAIVASNVVAYGQMVERAEKDRVFYLPVRYSNGKTGLYQTADFSMWNLPGVPDGATPVAQDLWLKDGKLWRQVDGSSATVVASNVAAYGQMSESTEKDGTFLLPLRYTDASAAIYQVKQIPKGARQVSVRGASGVPRGAIPVAQSIFFTAGTLWYADAKSGAAGIGVDVAAYGQLVERQRRDGVFSLPVIKARPITTPQPR